MSGSSVCEDSVFSGLLKVDEVLFKKLPPGIKAAVVEGPLELVIFGNWVVPVVDGMPLATDCDAEL